MTTAMTTIKKWQDNYLTMLTRVEEPVVTYTAKAIEAIADYVPERPQWAFLNQVPTITEFVDSQRKFRRRFVDQQAAFVREVISAIDPALTKVEPKAPATKKAASKR